MKALIEHNGKTFADSQIRPFEITRRAIKNYYQNECEIALVTGMPEGVGKSVYVTHSLADVQGYLKCKEKDKVQWMWKPIGERPENAAIWESDYEAVKPLILYTPEEVVNFLLTLLTKKERIPMWHWDDAGSWLNSMEWSDPFVIAFMELIPLARSFCGLAVLSSPVEEWILKKLHTAKGVIHCPVVKLKDSRYFWRPRECKAYKKVMNIYRNRSFPRYVWRDRFPAIEPDSFHAWYKPKRDHYCLLAAAKMKLALDKRRARGVHVELDEAILAEIRGSIERANDKSKELLEIAAQFT